MSKPKRRDASLHVEQRDKLKDELSIREFPWTPKQREFINIALDKNAQILILDGLPGTSKSLLAVYCVFSLMKQKKISDIVYIRSLIQARDGETGFLQGDLAEKTHYYNVPLTDKLEELLDKISVEKLFKDKRITCFPTSMLRGYNFNTKAIILDEAQNATFDSLLTVITRTGKFSKLFILGDTLYQNDLGKLSGFKKMCEIFNTEICKNYGIHYFHFGIEDILRSGLVRFIMERIEEFNKKNDNLQNY